MGLLDDIQQLRSQKRPRCGIAIVRDQLDEQENRELTQAFADPDIAHGQITAVLKRRFPTVSHKSVERHRRGECVCESL